MGMMREIKLTLKGDIIIDISYNQGLDPWDHDPNWIDPVTLVRLWSKFGHDPTLVMGSIHFWVMILAYKTYQDQEPTTLFYLLINW